MKKIFLLATLCCLACTSSRTLTKDEAIKYASENYTSKVELTPTTLIKFRTNNFSNDVAKEKIRNLASYGYDIELNDSLNGEKKLNTKEEFIAFYGKALLPLNKQDILDLEGELTFKLIGNELQISSFTSDEIAKDTKIFQYRKDGYKKTCLENFIREHADYKYSVTITTTFTY